MQFGNTIQRFQTLNSIVRYIKGFKVVSNQIAYIFICECALFIPLISLQRSLAKIQSMNGISTEFQFDKGVHLLQTLTAPYFIVFGQQSFHVVE